MLNDTFIVFDLETTGLSPRKNEVIQFAGQKFKGNQLIDQLCVYIKQPIPLPSFITKFTGITDEILNNEGVPPQAAYTMIMEFCEGVTTFVGHNAKQFDRPFLVAFCDKYHDGRLEHQPPAYTLIDTMWDGAKFNQGRRPKLSKLCELLQVDFNEAEAHNAIYDVDRTAACLFKMKNIQRFADDAFEMVLDGIL